MRSAQQHRLGGGKTIFFKASLKKILLFLKISFEKKKQEKSDPLTTRKATTVSFE